jgi:hypothetical protein
MRVGRIARTFLLAGLGLTGAAGRACADFDPSFTATLTYDDNTRHGNNDPQINQVFYDATFTVKDLKGNPAPKGTDIWVKVGKDTGDDTAIALVHLTTTDDTGVVKSHVAVLRNETQPVASAVEVDCKTGGKDPHGQVTFKATTGTLTYVGGTMAQVSYSDMTSTSVNTPTETIIGANVSITGLHLLSSDGMGNAAFTGGTFSIASAAGTYLQADYNGVSLSVDPTTGDSILMGLPSNDMLNTGLGSRFVSDLAGSLATGVTPTFELDLGANLAAATSDFTQTATVSVTDCPFGQNYLFPLPEPSSWALLAGGGSILVGISRRGRRARR